MSGERSGDGPTDRAPRDVVIRPARPRDAAAIWRAVRDGGELDLNSPYAYLLLCRYFTESCLVAEREGELLGFVLAFLPPENAESVFVWQIGVSGQARGLGLGRRLLSALVDRARDRGVRYLEASITPDNRASWALFRSIARRRGVPCRVETLFPAELFPGEHPPEERIRIGPFAGKVVVVTEPAREAQEVSSS